MKLSEVTKALGKLKRIEFKLPNQSLVPSHFHVTEVGRITRHFIDCGGTLRLEECVNFQLFSANDYDHRLHPEKLIHIIELSKEKLHIPDVDVEVEYQGHTIEKYALDFDGSSFLLMPKHTDCLAKDNCGIPVQEPQKRKIRMSQLSACDPNSNCC